MHFWEVYVLMCKQEVFVHQKKNSSHTAPITLFSSAQKPHPTQLHFHLFGQNPYPLCDYVY